MLEVRLTKQLRDFAVNVDLEIPRGIAVMLGPSGHGKTTILNMVAGIATPDSGTIRLDGKPLFDGEAGIDVPPEGRGVGYVFQDYALFPHMSVFDNVAYGLRTRKVKGQALHDRVMATLDRLALSHLRDAHPARLSAGQRQRVAMGRALIVEPRIMLMDEPLGALDMQLRARVRSELKALLLAYDIPAIVVTHDPMDAVGLGGTVIVMEHGRVVQQGTYESLLAQPATRFIAEFVESNAYSGTVVSIDDLGDARIRLDDGVEISAVLNEPAERVLAVIHPWDFSLSRTPFQHMRNGVKGRVTNIAALRDRVRVMVDGPMRVTAEVTKPWLDDLDLSEGEDVYVAFKSSAVRIFPDGPAPQ